MQKLSQLTFRQVRLWALVSILCMALVTFGMGWRRSVDAACAALPTPNGAVTQTVNIPATATYTVWSRMNVPDTSANSYFLEIDDTTCGVIVGDGGMSANNWVWVNHRDGNTSSRLTVNLTAGTHTVRLVGRETGVKLDRVVFTADTTCVPTGFGDNCASPPLDTAPPTVNLTAPSAGQTVSGTVNVTATANDNVGVTRIEFLVDNQLAHTDTGAPFTMSWNTTAVSNGPHSITARAFDGEGNSSTSGVNVSVSNSAPQPTFRPADINQDGRVSLQDFALLAAKYGQQGGDLGRADINQDGRVNLQDFALLASQYGT